MNLVFDERGIFTRGIDDIRTEMQDEAKVRFADVLDGKELLTDDSSLLGRTFAITAKPIVETEDVLTDIVASMNINSANGQTLDNLLENLWLIPRKGSSQAVGDVIVYGVNGSAITKGSQVSNSINGDVFELNNDVEFKQTDCSGVDLQIESLNSTYELSYTIDGFFSQSPVITVVSPPTDTTKRQVAERIISAVNSQSSYLTATRNNDDSVRVFITDESRTGTFFIGGSLSFPRTYMKAGITSVTYNSSESKAEQINSINTSIPTWLGVRNPFTVFESTGTEGNEDYRYRAKLSRNPSANSKRNSLIMAIKSVRGVTYENIQANTSQNTTNSGITNNGLAITVMGGNEEDIAVAIFNSIADGIATVGTINKTVKDLNGNNVPINFSRPSLRKIGISFSLIVFPNFPSNGKQLIRQAIVDYFNNLQVGQDIYYSRLSDPINKVDGFAFRNLQIGFLDGTAFSNEDLILSHNELATINAEDIIIGGSSSWTK